MSDPRREYAHILRGEGGVCEDVYNTIQEHAGLELGFREVSNERLWWTIDMFLPTHEAARLHNVWRQVRSLTFEAAKTEFDRTGIPQNVSDQFVNDLQRRILFAFQPSLKEVIEQAKPSIERWAQILLQKIPEAQWQAQ